MNKADLVKLGFTDEALEKAGIDVKTLDKVIVLHGKDIEAKKSEITSSADEIATLKTQLEEAGTQIADFKKLDPEQIQKAADDWKQKATEFETAATEAKETAAKELTAYKLTNDLKAALKDDFNVRDPDDLIPLLKLETIVRAEDGKGFVGLTEQVEPYKESKDYLFNDSEDIPKIIDGVKQPKKVSSDAFDAALRKGAGLAEPK